MHSSVGVSSDSVATYSTPVRATSQGSDNPAVTSRKTSVLEQDSPFVLDYGEEHQEECKTAKRNEDLAFTIVWSPLPPITWLIPFIGHTGICDSSGVASDFRGPYYVGDDGRMAFGAPTRALKIEGIAVEAWDAAIQQANEEYRGRMHNICCDNCHSHVAYALNKMGATAYGIYNWDMIKICFAVFFKGRFLSLGGFLLQFLPFSLLVLLIAWIKSK